MNCKQCKNKIQKQRLYALPKTKVCVSCSTTEAVSCVDVIYHKTGNTIQIMDKQSADKINKLAKRSGFGIMSGMKGSSGGAIKSKPTSNVKVWRLPTEEDYQRVLKKIGMMIDIYGRIKCIDYIDEQYYNKLINSNHAFNLRTIVETLLPKNDITQKELS